MRAGCALTAITVTGLLLYGLGSFKGRMPAGEQLEESINKIKEFRSSAALSSQTSEGSESFADTRAYREFLRQEGVEVEFKSPVIDKILKRFENHKTGSELISSVYIKYLRFSQKHIKWGNYYIFIAIILAAAGILLNNAGSYSLAALMGKFVFFGARFLLFAAASAAIIFWALIGKNLWLDAGINLFLGPLELVGGSIIILKVYDPNYPVLNRVILSILLPAVSSIILAVS